MVRAVSGRVWARRPLAVLPIREAEDAANEVAQGGHERGGVVAADLAGVLGEGDVFGPVDGVLDDPVAACPGSDLGSSGLLSFKIGDGVDSLSGPLLRTDPAPLTAGADDLADVREVQAVDGDDLGFADLLAPVGAVAGAVEDGHLAQGSFLNWRARVGWLFFTDTK